MPDTPEFWHKRYTQQVGWTLAARRHIFGSIKAHPEHAILEVGCGSGALLKSLAEDGFSHTVGLDIDPQILKIASQDDLITADALKLPFSPHCFDICLCHFLLLWVADPLRVLREMARVTLPGGWVIALAEPDYGGRIDYPDKMKTLGEAQTRSLQDQGADVYIGRKLRSLFAACGLGAIRSGIISAEWDKPFSQADFDLEWDALRKDLQPCFSAEELKRLYQIDLATSRDNSRVLFVPIFYAFGQVPSDK